MTDNNGSLRADAQRLKDAMHAPENTHAPNVEPAWRDEFVVALRLRDASGEAIGDALAEVDAHCSDSGESAHEAFGDPGEYARSLELPSGALSPSRLSRTMPALAISMAGMLAAVWSFTPLLAGEALSITVGHALSVVLLGAAVALVATRTVPVLQFVTGRPVLAWLVVMAYLALTVVALIALETELFSIGALPVVVVGVTALLAGALLQRRALLSGSDPVTPPEGSAREAGMNRAPRVAVAVTPWLFTIFTAVMMVIAWLVNP